MLLDLARCPIDRAAAELFYEQAAVMVRGYPAILGPELTWYLRPVGEGGQLELSLIHI